MKIKDDEILVIQVPSSLSRNEVETLSQTLQEYIKAYKLKTRFMIIENNIKLNKMTYAALERVRDKIELEIRIRKAEEENEK